jgi:hypothetical protein
MTREMALTVTTDDIRGWGIVGCLILAIATALVIRLARSVVGRLVWTVLVLLLLVAVWNQRGQVTDSVKRCDPQILGFHLKVSDPTTRAKCVADLAGHN